MSSRLLSLLLALAVGVAGWQGMRHPLGEVVAGCCAPTTAMTGSCPSWAHGSQPAKSCCVTTATITLFFPTSPAVFVSRRSPSRFVIVDQIFCARAEMPLLPPPKV